MSFEPDSKSAVSTQDRTKLDEHYMEKWCTGWFLINNFLYWGWEAATYGNDFSKSEADVLKEKNALGRALSRELRARS